MEEVDFTKIGYRIKSERTKQNLSQESLAELTGLSPNYISHIERGKTKLSVQSLVNISNALSVTADQLLMDSIDKNFALLNNELSEITSQLDDKEMFLASELCKAILNTRKFTK